MHFEFFLFVKIEMQATSTDQSERWQGGKLGLGGPSATREIATAVPARLFILPDCWF
jgi:hypothetical protein